MLNIHTQFSRFQSLLASKVRSLQPLLIRLRRYWTNRRLLIAGGTSVLVLGAVYGIAFHWPRTVQFSYEGKNCFTNPTVLPNLTGKQDSKSYSIEQPGSLSIAGYPVYSHQTCVTPTEAPQANTEEKLSVALPGNFLTEKTVTVRNKSLPGARSATPAGKPVSTKDPLLFTLTTTDKVFSYRLEVNDAKAPCTPNGEKLECQTAILGLEQGTQYTFRLVRLFGGKNVGTVLEQNVSTVEPVQVVSTSIAPGQLVYNTPTEVIVTLNKPVTSLESVSLEEVTGNSKRALAITHRTNSNRIAISFNEALPRSASLVVTIGDIRAADGGYLTAPFALPFQTSGGPKVKGVSIGSYKIQPSSNIILTFDVTLAPGQNLANYIRVEAGSTVAASITAQGNRVTIDPADLGRCVPFTVKVSDGLKSEFGITGNSAWQFKSRTICQTIFSIGSSVQGRGITGYRFGSGPNKIIFVGGTHGDERSSVQILNRWVDQLEANPGRIPAHQTIIVIPVLNPDGYAANRRTNANNVDLNRNFPANNWKSGVTMPDKSYLEHGGGTEPLSEPESRALANYVTAQSPRLVLTYHAAGGVVVPNGSGDSDPIAVQYGKKSSVGYMSNSQTGTFFEYDTTGAFEDWLHDKRGIPALLIELRSRTSNDYSGHANALWYIAGL
jgi:murein peptide amidase A